MRNKTIRQSALLLDVNEPASVQDPFERTSTCQYPERRERFEPFNPTNLPSDLAESIGILHVCV